MNLQQDDLPLIDLFDRLRDAGLPLGIGEYQLVIKALQVGFGIPDHDALARLCRTLWVKTPEEESIFDHHFQKLFSQAELPQSSPKKEIVKPKKSLEQRFTFLKDLRPPERFLSTTSLVLLIIFLSATLSVGWYLQKTQRNAPNPELVEPTKPNLTDVPLVEPTPIETPETIRTNPEQPLDIFKVVVFGSFLTTFSFSGTYAVWLLLQWLASRRTQREPLSPEAKPHGGPSISEMIQSTEDPIQLAKASGGGTTESQNQSTPKLFKPTEYLPVTRRQMKQSWRFLRRPVRQGPRTELDIDATVEQFGRKGSFLEPVLVPRRVNQTELLILVDHDGSMVPFHDLSKRLVDTAVHAGRLGKTSLYYFQNCPTGYLWKDPYRQEAQAIPILLEQLSKRTVVMIVSDAGAARGGFNQHRLNLTIEFLELLNNRVGYGTWLNPMSQERWDNTTAASIAGHISMFEVSRQGFQQSIDVLRGR